MQDDDDGLTRHHWLRIAGVATILVFAVLSAAATWMSGGRTGLFDGPLLDLAVSGRHVLFGSTDPPDAARVAVVGIDWRSLDAPELEATPRALMQPVWEKLVKSTLDAGASAIAFDALLVYSGNNLIRNYDRSFLLSLRQYGGRVVLGRSAGRPPDRRYRAVLQASGGKLGLLEMQPDGDGIYRRLPNSFGEPEEGTAPTLVNAALQLAAGPPMPESVLLVPRRHPELLPTYSIVDVMRCADQAPEALRTAFEGRVVFVGTLLPEEDRKLSTARFLKPPAERKPPDAACPLQTLGASNENATTVPGVHLHAMAADQILRDQLSRQSAPAWSSLAAGLAGGVGALASLLLSPALALGVFALGGIALLGIETLLLEAFVWFPAGPAIVSMFAAVVITYLGRYLLLERNREEIKAAFSRYLSPDMVNALASDPARLKLGGETKELTLLFCDIRGFTTISEAYKHSPETLTRLVNRLLTPLSDEILKRRGTIDKYMGDCIMAFWNAPLDVPHHAALACESGLAMLESLVRVNHELEAEAKAEGRPFKELHVGVGLNTGEVVVGNMGSNERFDYSVLGDAVNLAARLEGQSRGYGVDVVIGEATASQVPEYAFVELDLIAVKGKLDAVRIFTLLGRPAMRAEPAFQALLPLHQAFLERYRARDWEGARTAMARCREAWPGLAGYYAVFERRIRDFMTTPPPPDWDGVYRAETK